MGNEKLEQEIKQLENTLRSRRPYHRKVQINPEDLPKIPLEREYKTRGAILVGVYFTSEEHELIAALSRPDTVTRFIKRSLYQQAKESCKLSPCGKEIIKRMAYPENSETWI